MSFITDKQTLEDLNIPGKYKPGSIFSLFNQVHTAGGEKLLDDMFNNPLCNADEINERIGIFKYFQQKQLTFPFSAVQLEVLENYLRGGTEKYILVAGVSNFKKLILGSVITDGQYTLVKAGVQAALDILDTFYEFISGLEEQNKANPYEAQIQFVKAFFNDKRLDWFNKEKKTTNISFFKLTRYGHLLSHTLQSEMKALLTLIYHLDVYIAVSNIAEAKNFSYATALPKENNCVKADKLRHPSIENAVGNTIFLRQECNMLFLTGANMAGKSTLMKTFGIAVYLAHIGFPVAADNMEFSVKDCIYTSINVPDNLGMGYSHFYAEVLRVKKVATEVSNSKDVIVIFDELFKGTNVKDAYDATLAVTEAFSAYTNCFFVISTHIIEVGETLKDRCRNIQFSYLPTVMEGTVPRYPYKLTDGITTDRQGMIIIENEGILEILKDVNTNQ